MNTEEENGYKEHKNMFEMGLNFNFVRSSLQKRYTRQQ